MSLCRAVFLDRDGTLMEEVHYCNDPSQVRVYPGVPAVLRRLKAAGFRTFIITNQSGIGRGLITDEEYQRVQAELLRQLGPELIDKTYYCPDSPAIPSTRRKPAPGMVWEAAQEFGVDLPISYLIGDKAADIECACRAGTHSILVMTGYGAEQRNCSPELRARDLVEAVEMLLKL
jgi:D-glycero-D-manno-heptose 1,7-bisphosphate phosphatase